MDAAQVRVSLGYSCLASRFVTDSAFTKPRLSNLQTSPSGDGTSGNLRVFEMEHWLRFPRERNDVFLLVHDSFIPLGQT